MEGKQGTIIYMRTKTAPTVTPNLEGGISVQIGQKGVIKQSFESSNTKSKDSHPDDSVVEDFHSLTTKPFETGLQPADQSQEPKREQKPDSEKTPDELLAEKREKLEELFEQLGERLDSKTKEQLMNEYLDKLLHDDTQEKDNNLEDTFAEIKRLLALLFALFLMLILNPDKTHFTGKDLGLEEKAPEGESNDVLSQMMNGRTFQESWDGFKKEVEGIEKPVPFAEFMSLVLAANERHSVKKFKIKNSEGGNSNPLQMGKKKGLFRRMIGLIRRRAPTSGR